MSALTGTRVRRGVARTPILRESFVVCLECGDEWRGSLAFIRGTEHVRSRGHEVTAESLARHLYTPAGGDTG